MQLKSDRETREASAAADDTLALDPDEPGRAPPPATPPAVPAAPTGDAPAPQAAPDPAPAPAPAAPPRRSARKRVLLVAVLALAIGAAGTFGYRWWTVGRFEISTDDAYLGADMSILAAKVSGYVTDVEVAENQAVKTGDVIARIDDGDYRLAVRAAEDKIAVQQAAVARFAVQIDAARTQIDEAKANVTSARADLVLAEAELDRKARLVKSNVASRETYDTAKAAADKASAALAAAQATEKGAEANVAVLEAERKEAEASLASLSTALRQARRDLSFTVVRAPIDGIVGNKAAEVGELVQPGTRLAAVVPLASVYVNANFKETQLEEMRPGQRAEVTVDAFPGEVFEGYVESISPASGALFSLLPPQNATGNFTKIVQRLPVRVALSDEARAGRTLRPGMSAVVTVDRRTGPGTAGPAAPPRRATPPEPEAEGTPVAAAGLPRDTAAAAEPAATARRHGRDR
ncbi:HlyD family secretion protein [Acuticoccus sp. I52.16.1]|uniref:HlyD family secretion protein n=1 Tax=Acuticoccus sp. I52.16.1 TaxID=2928472 RepID=UPI001FD3E01A|nr:HlyD family secretion protein [Acuticoccus sp. I52.16.1]UOM37269.1 HlyD family secretion protein [Acuticoccus sp. I52.16.1]